MNAYELSDELLRDNTQLTVTSAYMLRQQADRIAELEKFNKAILKKGGYPHKPLSDEEICQLWKASQTPTITPPPMNTTTQTFS